MSDRRIAIPSIGMPNPVNGCSSDVQRQGAHAALDDILDRVKLQCETGFAYLRMEIKGGGIRGIKVGIEVNFQTNQ